jgi:hypothetical protein
MTVSFWNLIDYSRAHTAFGSLFLVLKHYVWSEPFGRPGPNIYDHVVYSAFPCRLCLIKTCTKDDACTGKDACFPESYKFRGLGFVVCVLLLKAKMGIQKPAVGLNSWGAQPRAQATGFIATGCVFYSVFPRRFYSKKDEACFGKDACFPGSYKLKFIKFINFNDFGHQQPCPPARSKTAIQLVDLYFGANQYIHKQLVVYFIFHSGNIDGKELEVTHWV